MHNYERPFYSSRSLFQSRRHCLVCLNFGRQNVTPVECCFSQLPSSHWKSSKVNTYNIFGHKGVIPVAVALLWQFNFPLLSFSWTNNSYYVRLIFLSFNSRYVICCAFSPNGRLVASGSNDRSFNVWSIAGILDLHDYDSSSQSGPDVGDDDIGMVCPITQDLMRNPDRCSDGFIYERAAIQEWIVSRRKTSPMTNLPLNDLTLTPQPELQSKIRIRMKERLKWILDLKIWLKGRFLCWDLVWKVPYL